MLISGSLGNDVHKQSANKFFVKTARKRLDTSISLETTRGYFYTIKPGMGNIILNFNIATSAFFRPILVSEFLEDRATFTNGKAESLLKNMLVHIEFDRFYEDKEKMDKLNSEPSRMKTISGLSEQSIDQLTFRVHSDGNDLSNDGSDQSHEVRVIDHLRAGR